MRVLVIPEDFVKDQYILQPLVEAMMEASGKPRARVRICHDPRLGGVAEALKWERVAEILDRYPMIDLFLLCVDRDGVASGRRAHQRCSVLGCPWRIDFSRTAALLMASRGSATSISFFIMRRTRGAAS